MNELSTIVAIIAGVLGVLGTIGGGYAVIRSNVATTTIELYKSQVEALNGLVSTLEQDAAGCKARLEALEEANRTLDTTVKSLREELE